MKNRTKNNILEMQSPKLSPKRLDTNEDGATLVEYVILASVIAVVCFFFISEIGKQTSKTLPEIDSALQQAHGGPPTPTSPIPGS